jgi:hypothetical protein
MDSDPANQTQMEDVLSKYKRLLSLARSNLEANQASLAEKDQQIATLRNTIEDIHKGVNLQPLGREEELVPRRISHRINTDDAIWVLVEYDVGSTDRWVSFKTQDALLDFCQKIQGVPLKPPAVSLTPEESTRIVADADSKVERIVEEFRRFKVRTEIARKQKDAEFKHSQQGYLGITARESLGSVRGGESSGTTLSLEDKRRTEEDKWKAAYEKVTRENEVLRSQSGEALLANQWRERYEACLREKESLNEKLKVLLKSSDNKIGQGAAKGKSLEQAYLDALEESKDLRKRLTKVQNQRQLEVEKYRKIQKDPRIQDRITLSGFNRYDDDAAIPMGAPNPLEASKMNYVKQMFLKYLLCSEHEVKEHIESALIAIFRFNSSERRCIEERRKNEEKALGISGIDYSSISLDSLTNFFVA